MGKTLEEKKYENGEFHFFQWESFSNVAALYREVESIFNNMPRDCFMSALNWLLGYLGMSKDELAHITDTDNSQISKYCTPKKDKREYPSMNKAVSICLALRLPPRISVELLKEAGYHLPANRRDYNAYRVALNTCYIWDDVDGINEAVKKWVEENHEIGKEYQLDVIGGLISVDANKERKAYKHRQEEKEAANKQK